MFTSPGIESNQVFEANNGFWSALNFQCNRILIQEVAQLISGADSEDVNDEKAKSFMVRIVQKIIQTEDRIRCVFSKSGSFFGMNRMKLCILAFGPAQKANIHSFSEPCSFLIQHSGSSMSFLSPSQCPFN
jgi:hypothetical protein